MIIRLFDTESTALNGIMGELLSYSFKDLEDTEVTSYHLDVGIDERDLLTFIKEDLEEAHIIVGWNSKLHDIPFINARCAKHGLPLVRPQMHLDIMYYAGGSSLKIGSKKMRNVAKYFKTEHQPTELDWDIWKAASKGDLTAVKEVVHHCDMDILSMEEIYWQLIPNVRNIHR